MLGAHRYRCEVMKVILWTGDCFARMRDLENASVDAVVVDPPYGLEFMGSAWDSFKVGRSAKYAVGGSMSQTSHLGGAPPLPSYVKRAAKRCRNCRKQAWSGSPCVCKEPEWEIDNSPLLAFGMWSVAWLEQAFRVIRTGGVIKAFGGNRTFHRLAHAMEDVGFIDLRVDAWCYATGFPKSHDVSKDLDRLAGVLRPVTGYSRGFGGDNLNDIVRKAKTVRSTDARGAKGSGSYGVGAPQNAVDIPVTEPATDAAKKWSGWGTALKPAWEPIVIGRRP